MKDEPAFPTDTYRDRKGIIKRVSGGLTKREMFAAMAMQGMLPHYFDSAIQNNEHTLARYSTNIADALIKELERE